MVLVPSLLLGGDPNLLLYLVREAAFNTMLYGWLHCTLGDVLITIGSFWVVSLVVSDRRWFLDLKGGKLKFIGFIALGVIYTFFSEWLNVHIFRSWDYAESMPIIPWVRMGLTHLRQLFRFEKLTFNEIDNLGTCDL